MKHTSLTQNLLVVVLTLAPLAWLFYSWNEIPPTVVLHYNIHLKPDRMGSKSNLAWMAILLSAVGFGLYMLLKNIHKIDPKRAEKISPASFGRLAMVLLAFFSLINILVIYSAAGHPHLLLNLLCPILGLLLAAIGNYLPALKPNYFAGIRLPWTLNSEYNWKKTHQLAGILWFWGGILLTVLGLLLPPQVGLAVMLGAIVVLVIVPCVYSFRLFKKEQQTKPNP